MKKFIKVMRFTFAGLFAAFVGLVLVLAGAYAYIAPQLPATESLKDIQFQVPLRVYTRDGKMIAEFGEKKRSPVRYPDVPDRMVKAFLAAEDDRFFTHPGVDYQGIVRAALHLVRTGEKGQGGSTITMQVARNFFLSSEKTYARKLSEIFLALQIERELSKEEILELYLNKIYLGNRAYGVQAAAQVYYGKDIGHLSDAQTAMIAGLPKAPSSYNPVINPSRALTRRNYVLRRMRELDFLSEDAYQQALAEPVTARLHGLYAEVQAPYVAEMARAEVVAQYGSEAYTAGFRVYTTLDGARQESANRALRGALLDYDRRHGYRGAEHRIDLATVVEREEWDRVLTERSVVGGLVPGLVTEVQDREATVYLGQGAELRLEWEGLEWAARYIDDNRTGPKPETAADVLQPGDVIRLQPQTDAPWLLAQIPAVAGALVALEPKTGAVVALVGGFDYFHSKFNRVTQARRQPGSSFKPFIYSAALEKGFTPASLINDAPVVFEDPALESTWRPENYSGKFYGPTRMREALVNSRNLVSIRLLRAIGIDFAIQHAARFGLPAADLPRNLSLALGSGAITPLELTSAYAVFANGGFRVQPYFVQRLLAENGEVLFEADPAVACEPCETEGKGELASATGPDTVEPPVAVDAVETRPVRQADRAISTQNNWLMNSMMRDVVARGTGQRAMRLGRRDLAGKTGTTNDQRDAWFAGFNSDLAATAWVGFDMVHPLGQRETGARAALPMWMAFMQEALDGVAEKPLEQPSGLVTVRIDPETGLLAGSDTPNAVFETFRLDNVPNRTAEAPVGPGAAGVHNPGGDPIF